MYTPKHGSWLNVAECELSCLTSQCLSDRRIADIMTRNPRTIGPDKLAVEAVQIMEERKVNQLLVVGGDGRLVGALNMHDLFRAKVI